MPAFHLEFCETELSSKVYPGNHFGGDETAGYVGDAAFHSANVAVKGFFSIGQIRKILRQRFGAIRER